MYQLYLWLFKYEYKCNIHLLFYRVLPAVVGPPPQTIPATSGFWYIENYVKI